MIMGWVCSTTVVPEAEKRCKDTMNRERYKAWVLVYKLQDWCCVMERHNLAMAASVCWDESGCMLMGFEAAKVGGWLQMCS
jgi:hypothetical protein